MRALAAITAAAFIVSCGKKDDGSSKQHLNPSKIEGTYYGLGPWSITIPGMKETKNYADLHDDFALNLQPTVLSFGAIVNARTGATRMFWPKLKTDSCSDYRETPLPGETWGRTTNGGYWFTGNDETGNFASYVANIRRYDFCLTMSISPEPGAKKFSSNESDLIDYFNRFLETVDFDRLRKVHRGYFNNRTFMYSVFFSDHNNETITESDGIKHTYSTAPILTNDGQRNEVVSEGFFGDCQLDVFKGALADEKKKILTVSNPSEDLTSKYSLELITEPDGTFNRMAEGIYMSTKSSSCLIVRYYLKAPVQDENVAANDSELDQMFLEELGEMLVSEAR